MTIIDKDSLAQLLFEANSLLGDILAASYECDLDELSLLVLEFSQKVCRAIREIAKVRNFEARNLCKAAAKTVHFAKLWMEHTFCLQEG